MSSEWWSESASISDPEPDWFDGQASEEASRVGRLGVNSVVTGVVGGFVGGLVGIGLFAAVVEIFDVTGDNRRGALAGVVASSVGVLVLFWPELTARVFSPILRRGWRVVAACAAAGLVGIAVATPPFRALSDYERTGADGLAGLVVAFAIVAAFVGAAIGAFSSIRKVVLGLVGGALGGAIGGLVIGLSGGGAQLALSRLVFAVPLATALLGGSIGAAERLGRRAWVEIVEGPLAGREVILYRQVTRVGTSSGNDLVLVDPDVASRHAELRMSDRQVMLHPLEPSSRSCRTEVNRREVQESVELSNDDLITLGNTYLIVKTR